MFPAASFFPELFESQLMGLSVTPLLDLQADALALSPGDSVSTWTDGTYAFTQTGTARPTYQVIDGYPAVCGDGVDDWMLGQNWAAFDNLNSFTIITVIRSVVLPGAGIWGSYIAIAKYFEDGTYNLPGWFSQAYPSLTVQTNFMNYNLIYFPISPASLDDTIISAQFLNRNPLSGHVYVNSNNSGESVYQGGTVVSYSNSAPVTLFATYDHVLDYWGFCELNLCAIRIYAPALTDIQRAAVEQELANRYGITL